MILGIGNDLTDIRRIEAVLARKGERYIKRCFSPREQAYCRAHPHPASAFAKRWAAKEACAKALGTGVMHGVFLKDMAVERDEKGKPALVLRGGARKAAEAMVPAGYVPDVHLSMSDEFPLAQAFVVIAAKPFASDPGQTAGKQE